MVFIIWTSDCIILQLCVQCTRDEWIYYIPSYCLIYASPDLRLHQLPITRVWVVVVVLWFRARIISSSSPRAEMAVTVHKSSITAIQPRAYYPCTVPTCASGRVKNLHRTRFSWDGQERRQGRYLQLLRTWRFFIIVLNTFFLWIFGFNYIFFFFKQFKKKTMNLVFTKKSKRSRFLTTPMEIF